MLPTWRNSLRTKFILVIVTVQCAVMGLVTLVVAQRQRALILHESRRYALSLGMDLAALSEGYLLSYNFVMLEQTVVRLAAQNDVAYALVHMHNGAVAAASGQYEMPGQVSDDLVSQQALQTTQPLIQDVTTTQLGGRGYDVAIPVFAPEGTRKWGTVRIGFSLARATHEMRQTGTNLFLLSLLAVGLGTAAAIGLALRISRPIQRLVAGVNEVAKGNYNAVIAVTSRDDIGYLAGRCEVMRQALRRHVIYLAEEAQRLETANRTLQDMQAQLIQREKLAAVGRLAAKVAHEVNNPLAVIKTSLRLMQKQSSEALEHKENLGIIEEEIERVARTIRQLVDLARPATQMTLLEVNEVIRKLMLLFESDLAQRGITCELDLTPHLPLLCMSPDHLKQLLLNLVKNAQEAMPEGGTLRLETAQHARGLRISVHDTGVGISPAYLPSLFEPFFSTKHGEGMGLGLSICYSIIKSYGGTIEVDSQPGTGSTFHLVLPSDGSTPGAPWPALDHPAQADLASRVGDHSHDVYSDH